MDLADGEIFSGISAAEKASGEEAGMHKFCADNRNFFKALRLKIRQT